MSRKDDLSDPRYDSRHKYTLLPSTENRKPELALEDGDGSRIFPVPAAPRLPEQHPTLKTSDYTVFSVLHLFFFLTQRCCELCNEAKFLL